MKLQIDVLIRVRIVLLSLFALTALTSCRPKQQQSNLIVTVKWGDNDHTAASDVYVEARGFVISANLEKSFVLHRTETPGQYEDSIPAGIYNVFVSDGSSLPQCKRIVLADGKRSEWVVNLEFDNYNSEK